uniref:Chromodomain-helicase-DNA-binding protein 7 n=1 Tax=Anopheles maculatus TaxID=74869 RepID=A0A182SIN7_9DIPT
MDTDLATTPNTEKTVGDAATPADKCSENEADVPAAEISKNEEKMETDEQQEAEKHSPAAEANEKSTAVDSEQQEKELTDGVTKESMETGEESPKAATEDTDKVEEKASSEQPNGGETSKELSADQTDTDKQPAEENIETGAEKMEVDEAASTAVGESKQDAGSNEAVKKEEASDEAATTSEKSAEVVKKEEDAATEEEKKPEPVFIDVEEYFVKYRNFSYLHCDWRTEDELLKGDKRVGNKIKRFLMKQQQQLNIFESLDEEPFNPDFVEVDRVLDVSELVDDEGKTVKHYLVKWKSLPYEDSTWELEDDVDQLKIEQYYRFNKIPPKSEWKTKKRPHPDQWKALPESPIFKGGNKLRPYQLEGLNWLRYSWYKGNNCILADEMGLGKTIQSLTFVNSVYEYGIRGPFLVIAPLSTIPNWQREFEGWTEMNVIVYHGSATSRQMIQDYEVYYRTETGKLIRDITKFNVLITTFEMIVTDYQDLKNFTWRACVIDEAHRLKNRNCKLLEGLRQLNLEHRVLLSGTPLQNNVNELFSLLNFLEPSQFACSEEFLREFGSLKTESEVLKLQALLKPMMLRRLKDDVEKSLAPKEETIVEVELTNIQKKYYRGILEQNFSFLMKGTTSANIPNLMNTMMELRKCCIHPYLLNGAEDQIQYDYRQQHGEDAESYYKNLIVSSGKMVLIDKLLPKLRANGHRVLIFSQMVRCLDILEDYLMYKKYPFERIDGRIRGNLRQAAIDRYSKPDSDRFVFLLCTKAGGLGINLTAADTVIIYDSDWNPQNDLQAQARCHRIGQQKMVKIYRLLCRNTYEREMFDKASLKLGLDKAVLQSMNTGQNKDGTQRQLSKKEIEDLLKKGAYGAVMDDDAGDKFCEEDIDSILLRRTQVITMESEKGSTFSKASFAAAANRSDINIDDPDFWNKWAKKAEIDPTACEKDETEDLVIAEPRRRTQIKRYGHDDGVMDISDESSGEQGSDGEEGGIGLKTRSKRTRGAKERKKLQQQMQHDDYVPRDRETLAVLGADEVSYGNWARSECFKVEKGLLSHGWARWTEILEQGQFKRGWREQDVEDCARVILLYCLERYQGDEKIKNFIWDLITPNEGGEQREIARNHSGLHNLVPRGRNAKGRKSSSACTTPKRESSSSTATGNNGNGGGGSPVVSQPAAGSTTPAPQCSADANEDASSNSSGTKAEKSAKSGSDTGGTTTPVSDPHHWSKDEKYDTETLLDINYKKHLTRHANKVLLRVRMLYYIKHEVLGDLVNQINEGANARYICFICFSLSVQGRSFFGAFSSRLSYPLLSSQFQAHPFR